ncbi:Crp/Fnr family transcriptional regulator [Belliella sp. R4-6]|uniref:Crp/Fnr family transcriptional regulator n=1 Tax=Belliella alkalica TaxID=1730871 RepID=A0ABS9VD55_9BACT|nr:Crp/Fnr family transcriptional regulator [Belliella alkalica]MCH7414357.1 Crp/Fnr family transcriptional regulator [Belliella alkalica]
MSIDQIIDNVFPVPYLSKLTLKNSFEKVHYPKYHVIIRADRVEDNIFFIKKGIARAFSRSEDSELTFWFGKEGDPAISLKSYVANQKGYEFIELLEDSELYFINKVNLEKLFEQDVHVANWGRKFAEQQLLKLEEWLISRQFKTAKERYLNLLKDNPEFVQRIQLRHIASFLGITQVSLSRIRSSIE